MRNSTIINLSTPINRNQIIYNTSSLLGNYSFQAHLNDTENNINSSSQIWVLVALTTTTTTTTQAPSSPSSSSSGGGGGSISIPSEEPTELEISVEKEITSTTLEEKEMTLQPIERIGR